MTDDFHQQNNFNKRMNQWSTLPTDTWELHALIADHHTPDYDGGGHTNRGTAPGSRTPWNHTAANMFFDIHAEIRRLESLLTLTLNFRAVYRAGSDAATRAIFENLPVLLHALHTKDPDSTVLDEALRSLNSLAKRAHNTLHPETRRTRAPWISCHLCGGDTWIYAEGHDINPKIDREHFTPGDAYCNRCAVFYPQDIWQHVARENARST